MKPEIISAQLKEKLQRHSGRTLAMCPWETADFLLKCGDALIKYIEHTNKQLEPDSEAFLSKSEIGKIDSLFRELGDNFFPMAHTTEPLTSLKIVNADEYQNLNNRVEDFLLNIANNYEMNLEESNEMNERNKRLISEHITEIRNLREEIRIVLNP
jgi:hypothetical protein